MNTKIFIYDSFTNEKFQGNQAGVVLEADNLTEIEMKNIAKELNYSETAFLFRSQNALRKVKFFTPNSEVDLCGHATIAYVKCMFDNNLLDLKNGLNTLKFETNIGILDIFVEYNEAENTVSNIFMTQDKGKLDYDIKNLEKEILESLNINFEDLGDIKMVKAYSGLWDLMINIKNHSILSNIAPNFEKVKEVSEKLSVVSFHLYALDNSRSSSENLKIYARNLAPIVDIPEESATGTSNGALAWYFYNINLLKEKEKLEVIQGTNMNRSGEIVAFIDKTNIVVGGNAVSILEGVINFS